MTHPNGEQVQKRKLWLSRVKHKGCSLLSAEAIVRADRDVVMAACTEVSITCAATHALVHFKIASLVTLKSHWREPLLFFLLLLLLLLFFCFFF